MRGPRLMNRSSRDPRTTSLASRFAELYPKERREKLFPYLLRDHYEPKPHERDEHETDKFHTDHILEPAAVIATSMLGKPVIAGFAPNQNDAIGDLMITVERRPCITAAAARADLRAAREVPSHHPTGAAPGADLRAARAAPRVPRVAARARRRGLLRHLAAQARRHRALVLSQRVCCQRSRLIRRTGFFAGSPGEALASVSGWVRVVDLARVLRDVHAFQAERALVGGLTFARDGTPALRRALASALARAVDGRERLARVVPQLDALTRGRGSATRAWVACAARRGARDVACSPRARGGDDVEVSVPRARSGGRPPPKADSEVVLRVRAQMRTTASRNGDAVASVLGRVGFTPVTSAHPLDDEERLELDLGEGTGRTARGTETSGDSSKELPSTQKFGGMCGRNNRKNKGPQLHFAATVTWG
ncbi:hypothetical protein FB451DRAFT_1467496 [Mycena latifolia]|nr:hypothetical protein FB451DRAFT_1467496 [Mycena latifolia]